MKAKTKKRKQTKTKKAAATGDPRELVRESWPEIVRALIVKALAGSYPHARFLAEMAKEGKGEDDMSDEALARLMMDELK